MPEVQVGPGNRDAPANPEATYGMVNRAISRSGPVTAKPTPPTADHGEVTTATPPAPSFPCASSAAHPAPPAISRQNLLQLDEAQLRRKPKDDRINTGTRVPHDFGSAEELLAECARTDLSIAELILANEDAFRPRERTLEGLDRIAAAMDQCVDRGLHQRGILPGGLKVARRAPDLWDKLSANPQSNEREQLFDWLNCYAMAVNEENAAGGRVVTAPTNGAAGIIPAVIRFYCVTAEDDACGESRRTFLLTAGAIGLLYKQRASISGAEMGCQGEVGVACSMAAGGLAAVWGANPEQVAQAAEYPILSDKSASYQSTSVDLNRRPGE